MKGYKTNMIPTTYTIGLLESIPDEEVRKKAIENFNERYAIGCENFGGGAAKISKAIEYAFDWEDSPEGYDYWENIYKDFKEKKI
jgi:hypothetical protein